MGRVLLTANRHDRTGITLAGLGLVFGFEEHRTLLSLVGNRPDPLTLKFSILEVNPENREGTKNLPCPL